MADLSLSVGRPGLKQQSLLPILDSLADIYHAGQAIPRIPELAETSNMNLRTLLEVLFRSGGFPCVKEFFTAHAYRISQPCKGTALEDRVVGVKYIDGLNNLWRHTWAREARGRFYYWTGEKVLCLKDTLQRGVEVLTHAHTKAAVTETQDMRLDAYDHLDDIQQSCIRAFQQPDGVLDAHLTGKVDGSLMIVSVYPRETEECRVMEEIIELVGDPFAKAVAEACACDGGPLLVVATQGTLLIGPDMQDYFVTSLTSLIACPIKSLKDTWATMAPRFCAMVTEYVQRCGLEGKRVHYCFEAFCKGRRSLWGRLHNELAIQYMHNGFNLLGAMVDNRYIPHFDMPQCTFAQPVHLHITRVSQVTAIMEDMDSVVLGSMGREDFLVKWGFPTDTVIHMEGWVLLTPLTPGAGGPEGGYDYAKIKTPLYYKCHKVRSAEVPALLALPTCCDETYPILRVLREFHTHAKRRFLEAIAATIDMLEGELALGAGSAFYEALPEKARVHFAPDRKDTVFRMLINVCGDLFASRVRSILDKVWVSEEDEGDKEDKDKNWTEMVLLVKRIMTKHMPWCTPLKDEVKREAMRDLYSILVESLTPA